jgi:cytoskeletal protein CcmA (bactofilin family)
MAKESVEEKRTVVDEGTKLKGTLESNCTILVHGRVEGDLKAPAVIVSATGAVQGSAKVGTLQSQGELSGEFEADRVELAGTVKDNTVIRARNLQVRLSSQRGKMQVIFGVSEAVPEAEQPAVAPANEPSRPPIQGRQSQPPS